MNKIHFITKTKGFTLIELLVVVLIIGILASIALPSYQKSVDKSRIARVWPSLATARQAADACLLANNGSHQICQDTTVWGVKLPEIDYKFSFLNESGYGSWQLISGSEAVVWGRTWGFALGIGKDGKRLCIGNEEGCKAAGFTARQNGYPYSTWGPEWLEP